MAKNLKTVANFFYQLPFSECTFNKELFFSINETRRSFIVPLCFTQHLSPNKRPRGS